MPEVTHATYSRIVDIPAYGSGISHLAHIETFFTVQRFKDHGRSVLSGMVSHFGELLAQEVAGFLIMRKRRYLPVESRNDDNPCRSQFAGCGDNLFHRIHTFLTDSRIGREDKTFKPCTNGTDFDITTGQGFFDFLYTVFQSAASRFKTDNTQLFHIVQLLVQVFTRSDAFLEREVQFRLGVAARLRFRTFLIRRSLRCTGRQRASTNGCYRSTRQGCS